MRPLKVTRETLYEMAYHALVRSATFLPADVKAALEKMYAQETQEMAKLHLAAFVENVELAAAKGSFACSDTGWPMFYVKIGENVQLEGGFSTLYPVAREAVMAATHDYRLRPTLVHPLTRENPGHNVGPHIPAVKVRFDPQIDYLEIIAVPKGGGSEMYGTFYEMLYAADGLKGIIQFVLDAFLKSAYAGQTCPPNIVGVGIGGTMEICTAIAKEAATLRPIGDRHPDPQVAQLEEELLEQLNALGVGPMGMGGRQAVFDVHIELAMTHSGAMPVAFVSQCAVARRASARIDPGGEISYHDAPRWEYR